MLDLNSPIHFQCFHIISKNQKQKQVKSSKKKNRLKIFLYGLIICEVGFYSFNLNFRWKLKLKKKKNMFNFLSQRNTNGIGAYL